uniref:Peptidase S8/S53 domain-containing protein n=1 Tax=Panagrolaimus sp. ES5 TaxID=591445 RepID=A0AC34FXQ4_9BILA
MSPSNLLKDYIPKDATQQSTFLSKYPKYDGRGITMAIIEDGIDIPSTWKNPSKKWHLGITSLFKPNETSSENAEKPTDCIVWFNGQKWLACIDTSFMGELDGKKVLTNFRDEYDYDIFLNNITYCVTVHNKGNLLEIFTSFKNHASVVAQIAAAHFPDEPERDGLAPGAQIISMNVYNRRYNNYMNTDALKKALFKCIELDVDIVNYSISNFPRVVHKIVKEMAEKHGILIFKSAGNYGPAYFSTIKDDAPIYNSIFIIGSVKTADMKKNIYNIEDDSNNAPKIYCHSSRGPAINGECTIEFVAPGSAITPVPRWNYFKRNYFKGTSAAAPNAAGAIACLLSALKENSIKYNPTMLRLALSKTAYSPKNGNKLEFGHGIIQIDAAFEFLKSSMNEIQCSNISKNMIKLYQTREDDTFKAKWGKSSILLELLPCTSYILRKCLTKKLVIELLNDTYKEVKGIIVRKSGREKYVITVFNNNGNFRSVPQLKLVSNSNSLDSVIKHSQIQNDSFTVEIDPSILEPGSLYFAEIKATDSTNTIFLLPITVILPIKVTVENNYSIKKELTFEPGIPQRFFIEPPKGSYHCCIKLTALNPSTTTSILIHHAIENYNVAGSKKILEFSSSKKVQNHSIT